MPDASVIPPAAPLDGFAPISLEEMDAVKLMNRVDTKYLTDEATLAGVLRDAAAAGYRVLVADGARVSPYDSIYFDTEGLRMFTDHRNQKLHRQKVRTRAYVNSGQAFLEIKRKNNQGRTKKKRTGIPMAELPDFRADEAACRYLDDHSDFLAAQLLPTLETYFRRITLVNPDRTERGSGSLLHVSAAGRETNGYLPAAETQGTKAVSDGFRARTRNSGVEEKLSFSASDQTRCQSSSSASACRPRLSSNSRSQAGRRMPDRGTRRAMSSITSKFSPTF